MSLLQSSERRTRAAETSPMVTMRQVALEAGVSYTTVSFVINGHDTARGIGVATRQRVLETANRLGYRHNGLARAVSLGKSQVIAVAVQSLELEFRARILSGVLEAAEEAGYLVKIISLAEHEHTIPREKMEQLAQARVAGVVAVNIEPNSLHCLRQELGRYGGLVAMVDDIPPQDWGIRVASDNEGGIRVAFEHLRSLGHEKIAFFGGPQSSSLSQERLNAFKEMVRRDELLRFPIIQTEENWLVTEEVEAQLRALLNTAHRPTALLCMGDLMAMRVVKLARRLGLSVPRDLSIVGYGDFAIAEIADPSLTSVVQPFRQMGHLAAVQLLHALNYNGQDALNQRDEGLSPKPFDQVLPVHLVARESSGPAPSLTLLP